MYRRFLLVSWAIILLLGSMWVATIADHFLRLGWGWDVQIIWLAPIIVVVVLAIRKLGGMIFDFAGKRD